MPGLQNLRNPRGRSPGGGALMTHPKSPTARVMRATVCFRPDQADDVRRLRSERRLSAVCQAAIDQISSAEKSENGSI